MNRIANYSPLTRALYTATSGMQVQNQRILVISQNLANTNTRSTHPGELPYRRQLVSLKGTFDKKIGAQIVQVNAIRQDQSPFERIYAPEDPVADKNGFVLESNVKPMVEMVDLREASHQHEANLKAFEKILGMLSMTVSLLKSNQG